MVESETHAMILLTPSRYLGGQVRIPEINVGYAEIRKIKDFPSECRKILGIDHLIVGDEAGYGVNKIYDLECASDLSKFGAEGPLQNFNGYYLILKRPYLKAFENTPIYKSSKERMEKPGADSRMELTNKINPGNSFYQFQFIDNIVFLYDLDLIELIKFLTNSGIASVIIGDPKTKFGYVSKQDRFSGRQYDFRVPKKEIEKLVKAFIEKKPKNFGLIQYYHMISERQGNVVNRSSGFLAWGLFENLTSNVKVDPNSKLQIVRENLKSIIKEKASEWELPKDECQKLYSTLKPSTMEKAELFIKKFTDLDFEVWKADLKEMYDYRNAIGHEGIEINYMIKRAKKKKKNIMPHFIEQSFFYFFDRLILSLLYRVLKLKTPKSIRKMLNEKPQRGSKGLWPVF